MRNKKYKCDYCNKELLFYMDDYVCTSCGVIYKERSYIFNKKDTCFI